MPSDRPMRIVSLLPSATEIVCALGAREELVGVSHECDFPADVKGLPKLTRPHIDSTAKSRTIHDSVAERVKKGLSLYDIDVALLAKLEPDIIITQDQCEVCAISLKEVEEALHESVPSRPKICSLQPKTLKDVSESFLQVGVMIDRFKEGVHLAKHFWDQLHALAKATKTESPPKVACIEWLDPVMIAGHWTPELVRLAGAEPVIVTSPEKFATIKIEEVLEAKPDAVFIFPCGFDLEKTREEMRAAFRASDVWKQLQKSAKLGMFLSDGNQFFNRSGPRLVDSAEIIACALNPESKLLAEKHHSHLEEVR